MRIVLLRHGRPHMPEWPSIPPREMGRWIDAYNRRGIASTHQFAFRCRLWPRLNFSLRESWPRLPRISHQRSAVNLQPNHPSRRIKLKLWAVGPTSG